MGVYPMQDHVPATDTPEVLGWLAKIDLSKVRELRRASTSRGPQDTHRLLSFYFEQRQVPSYTLNLNATDTGALRTGVGIVRFRRRDADSSFPLFLLLLHFL